MLIHIISTSMFAMKRSNIFLSTALKRGRTEADSAGSIQQHLFRTEHHDVILLEVGTRFAWEELRTQK